MQNLSFDLKTPYVPIEGKSEAMKLSPQEEVDLALAPLAGKTPVLEGKQKRAIVFWGPPGSGKTTKGHEQFAKAESPESFVTVCYDEKGALHSIPAYQQKNEVLTKRWNGLQANPQATDVDKQALFQERLDLYRDYRDTSQRIRSLTLNEAIERKHDLVIDITGAGVGAAKMMETLKKNGYAIELQGHLASAETAEARINERGTKVVEPEEVYTKRVGCYQSLPALAQLADKATISLNDNDNAMPVPVIDKQNGQLFWKSEAARAAFNDIAQKDIAHFAINPDAQPHSEALQQAATGCMEKLKDLPAIRGVPSAGANRGLA